MVKPESSLRGFESEQSVPSKPASHEQRPCQQTPLFEQSFGQATVVEQSPPVNPGSQKHKPMEQVPRSKQWFKHEISSEQVLPV